MLTIWIQFDTIMPLFPFLFHRKIRINFSTVLFKFYDGKVAEIAKSIVDEVCSHIKRIDVPDDNFEELPNIDNVNMGTTLFELYLVLKRFLAMGMYTHGTHTNSN